MAPPGTTSVEVEVNDVAKKLDGISVTADVNRVQAEQGQLEVVRLFAVNNTSKPPKTQMNDHNFEFYLPEGAKIVQSMAKTAGGQPLNSAPVPQAEKNRYAFIFPLRPGETQFQVAYQLPYSGSVTIDPKSIYGTQHLVVMFPKSMIEMSTYQNRLVGRSWKNAHQVRRLLCFHRLLLQLVRGATRVQKQLLQLRLALEVRTAKLSQSLFNNLLRLHFEMNLSRQNARRARQKRADRRSNESRRLT